MNIDKTKSAKSRVDEATPVELEEKALDHASGGASDAAHKETIEVLSVTGPMPVRKL